MHNIMHNAQYIMHNAQCTMHNWLRLLLLVAMASGQWPMVSGQWAMVQAQGIYVNKKGGESVNYPSTVFDKVTPRYVSTSSSSFETGAVADLKYEQVADMKTARMGHQVFPSGDGFVVVGGHTTGFQLTTTAELYHNGTWQDLTVGSPHDGAFAVTLSDGRVMVGGGFAAAKGVGQSRATDIYDPATQHFTAGPDMTVARSYCKAVSTGGGVYVSGNWYADDKVLDYYNGTAFTAVGDMDARTKPYLFTNTKGDVFPLAPTDNYGKDIAKVANSSGVVCLRGDKYEASTGKSFYYYYSAYEAYTPLPLTDEARMEDCHRTDRNGFLVLAKSADGSYLLTEPCPDVNTTYNHNKLLIPTKHPVTGAAITWRGGVFVNNAKHEAYIIGSSGTATNQTVHLISYNYNDYYWTIASAGGFDYNLMAGSWTLLADGRLACTGGNVNDNFDAQSHVYLFTPPVAGANEGEKTENWGVDVFKKDGSKDTYMDDELESITTYDAEAFDERITQEIPVEYLTKMREHMPIYSGNTPPVIEGTFAVKPNLCEYSSVIDRYEGKIMATTVVNFYDQNTTANTVMFRYEELDDNDGSVMATTLPAEAKVLGKGDNFTIFVIVEETDNFNVWTKMAEIHSGTVTAEGIKDYYNGVLMLDKSDDKAGPKMSVGTFRIFKDKDGLAEPDTWTARRSSARATGRNTVSLPLSTDVAPTAQPMEQTAR